MFQKTENIAIENNKCISKKQREFLYQLKELEI